MKWISIIAIAILFGACQKDYNPAASNTISSFPSRSQMPVGVMVEGLSDNTRLIVAKELGVNYVRAEVKLQNFTELGSYIDSLVRNNFKVVATFNYYGTQKSAPFTKNVTDVTNSINKVVKTFQPSLVAIENEEDNLNYHTGAVQDYINELAAATTALHSNGIKAMNGGITEDVLCILVYRDYLSQGLINEANDFAKRTMPTAIINDLPSLNNNVQLANRVAFTDSLIHAYKNMDFDYINFHWYEPVLARWTSAAPNAVNATQIDTKALNEVIAYLHNATNKIVVSNEAGELNTSPDIVKSILQQFNADNLPYVLWYSGDGATTGAMARAVALSNANGSLRSNGVAFRDFIHAN